MSNAIIKKTLFLGSSFLKPSIYLHLQGVLYTNRKFFYYFGCTNLKEIYGRFPACSFLSKKRETVIKKSYCFSMLTRGMIDSILNGLERRQIDIDKVKGFFKGKREPLKKTIREEGVLVYEE